MGTAPVNGTLGAIGAPSCTAGSCTASVTYTPAANYSGTDSFTFTVNDGTATSTAATVSITIANQAPTANADTATVAKNSTANVIDVLANDTDPEGDTLTVTACQHAHQRHRGGGHRRGQRHLYPERQLHGDGQLHLYDQ